MKTLGTRIRARRKELKLTQIEVGKKVGVSDATIGYWEKDVHEPTGTHLHALARTLKIDIDELLQDTYRVREKPAPYAAALLTPEALEVAKAFQRSSPEMQSAALRLLQVLEQSDSDPSKQ